MFGHRKHICDLCFSIMRHLMRFPLSHRPSWNSCGERCNDACPSETWWIVMNTACVFIWGKARGRQGEEEKEGGEEEEEQSRGWCGGVRLWAKTRLLLRHWCSTSGWGEPGGGWQEMLLILYASFLRSPFCVVSRRSSAIPLSGRGRALIKRPSSNCIFAPGVSVVLHYTVAHSPSWAALLTSMAGRGLY